MTQLMSVPFGFFFLNKPHVMGLHIQKITILTNLYIHFT